MELDSMITAGVGIVTALLGWYTNNISKSMDKLELKMTNVEDKINIKIDGLYDTQKDHEQTFAAHRESAAAKFVTREELKDLMLSFEKGHDKTRQEIRDLGARMDSKFDGLREKLDQKQDKPR